MLNKIAKFMKIKPINPKLKQSELGKELAISTSTLQRHRREINLVSPYRIPTPSTNHTRKQETSNLTEHDLKMTSNDLKMTSKYHKVTSKGDDKTVSKKLGSKKFERW